MRPARIAIGAPFVLTREGELYADASGRATDIALGGGVKEVACAGRIVVRQGVILEITNESPAFDPSLAHMLRLVQHLAETGADLSGDGGGVVVIVYDAIDEYGFGKEATRYRVAKAGDGVQLIPE